MTRIHLTLPTYQRQSNFELLRLVAIVLILLMHAFDLTDIHHLSSANRALGAAINAIGNMGVTVFVLISGYWGVRWSAHKFVRLVYLTTLYAVVVYLASLGLSRGASLASALLTVPAYTNWFVSCYLTLMLLSPYLNNFVQGLTEQRFRYLLILLFILLALLPTLFAIDNNSIVSNGGKSLVYFLFIYLAGRYIRLHQDVRLQLSSCLTLIGISMVLVFVLGILVSGSMRYLVRDNSPLMLAGAVGLFYLFKRISFSWRWLNYLAGATFAIYLLGGLLAPLTHYWIDLRAYSQSPFLAHRIGLLIGGYILIALVIDKSRELCLTYYEDRGINLLFTTVRRGIRRFKGWAKDL